MKTIFRTLAIMLAMIGMSSVNRAATINGTVTNKTANKPSAGDIVVLVDVSAGMGEAARATTDAKGHYSLQSSGAGPYLIRADHQGGSYFIAAPQGNMPADITVYDVAAKVEGVGIDADMLLIEAGAGTLHVRERYLVRNTSSPPRTQFSENTFEVVLPEGALLDEASATRPGGLGTRTHLIPLAQKGHYAFNVPIQPDQGEKETLFEVQYHFAYSGRHELGAQPQMPADNVVVYTAKGIEFAAKDSSRFRATQEDPRVETHVARNVRPGDEVAFTVSGEGQMPPDANAAAMQPVSATGGGMPGGGIGAPIASPDPLTGSKPWLLGGFAVVLAGAAFLVLRRRKSFPAEIGDAVNVTITADSGRTDPSALGPRSPMIAQSQRENIMLNSLKEELFALEVEKISGRIAEAEYAQLKSGLEALLKRAVIPKS